MYLYKQEKVNEGKLGIKGKNDSRFEVHRRPWATVAMLFLFVFDLGLERWRLCYTNSPTAAVLSHVMK